MATATQVPQTEQEWHEERKKGIGGSEVHSLFPILNLEDPSEDGSRYGCPRRLGYEKLGVEPDYQYTPQTLRLFERGHIMEEYAANLYAAKYGVDLRRSRKSWTSPDYPFMRCYVDRFEKIGEAGKRVVVEIKSANEHVTLRAQQEGLPLAYSLQIQHSIAATQADSGAFGVIVVPDFVDAVIEQIEEGPLRSQILNKLAPTFEFYSFPAPKDEVLIGIIIEKEAAFWNLIQAGKLPDPLPNLNDDRCSTCIFRKTCRGEAFVEANARIPVRDKKSGVVYAQITDPEFVQLVTDRLEAMSAIDKFMHGDPNAPDAAGRMGMEETLAVIDLGIKQNWPPEVGAVQIPGTGVKLRWNYQRGATRWDADALKADALTIGRKVAFYEWLTDSGHSALITEFMGSKAFSSASDFAEQYQKQGAPTRPFYFTVKD